MGVTTLKVLHGLVTPTNFYSVLQNLSPQSNVENFNVIPAGHVQPLFQGIHSVKPMVEFATNQVGQAMAEFGIFGADISSNVDLYYRSATDLGTRASDAGTVHSRLRAAQAFGYLADITARQGQLAQASLRVMATYDGSNEPLVAVDNAALTGITPAVPELYTLGPVAINGSTLPGVDELTLAFNAEAYEEVADGEAYVTFAGCKLIRPELRISSYTHTWATYGFAGTPLTSFTGYLRRKSADGINVANGTTSHLSVTASGGGIIVVETTEATDSEPAKTTLRIPLRAANAAGNAIALNTGVAIS